MIPNVERRIIRATSKLPGKMEKESLIIEPENITSFNEVKQFPYLIENNNKIKFDPFTGELYIATYRHNLKKEASPQMPVENIIYTQPHRKPVETIFKRWSRYLNIESAIRRTEHVLDNYEKSGKRVKDTQGIVSLTKNLLAKFESGEVNNENIEEIARETSDRLALLGFDKAEKPIKQRLAQQITFATGKDTLGRINPLISTTRLASAWLKAIQELLAAKRIREKFSETATGLLSERSLERLYLNQAAKSMQEIMDSQETDDLKLKINFLKDFSLSYLTPEKIKAAPYRRTALLSRYSLFGVKNKDERNLLTGINPVESRVGNFDELLLPIDKVIPNAWFAKRAIGEIQERVYDSLNNINDSLDTGRKALEEKAN